MFSAFLRSGMAWLLVLVLVACKEDPQAHQSPQTHSFTLPISTVKVQEIPHLYTLPGSVKSDERIQISSRITGYIQKITVHEGDKIKKGMPLVEIDATEIEAAIRRGQASVKSATTSLNDAQRDVSRLSVLNKKRVISKETYRKATVKRDVVRSVLAEAKAALDSALSQRRYASIKSPFNGITVGRHKEQGDLASPGSPILTIESNKRFLFETFIAESRIRHIQVGKSVKITIDAIGSKLISGTVLRVIPSGDPVTRRYQVEIALPDGLEVYPGMFGRADFIIGYDKSPVIAKKALIERGGLHGVFILGKKNRATFRWLRTGRKWKDGLEVKAGLKGGETIIALDDRRIHDGDFITSVKKGASDE